MSEIGPRYSHEEFGRRADDIYRRVVHPNLKPEDDGKFVAIDIETEDYSLDTDDLRAVLRLKQRDPNAQVTLMRTGPSPAHRI
jgi:hypothetical protein